MPLTDEEKQRYARHLPLAEVGEAGQEKLKAAKVLLVGSGGLGSPIAIYLAAAGVGTLGIMDGDCVDVSNLQRQIIHGQSDVGRPKVESARETLREINPLVRVNPIRERLSAANADGLLKEYDFAIDAVDNLDARYVLNEACVRAKKPFVSGSILRFEGQASVFWPGKGPCYCCLFPEPPPPEFIPSGAEAGILGILPGVIGTVEATEAVKIILGKGELLIGRLLQFDALRMTFRTVKFKRNPGCAVCGAAGGK